VVNNLALRKGVEQKMRSIVLLILVAMALSTAADGCCCGGGGLDGIGSPRMIENICPISETIRGPHMTYNENGRFGVELVIGPIGASSMAFVGTEDCRKLGTPCRVEVAEDISFGQEVAAHLDDVLLDFNSYQEMWSTK
jgi:hypothetical protein